MARVNLVRDFAALNGFESVTGDAWGLALAEDDSLAAADLVTLDQVALGLSDDEPAARRALNAANGGLWVPAVIQHLDHLGDFAWQAVTWRKAD